MFNDRPVCDQGEFCARERVCVGVGDEELDERKRRRSRLSRCCDRKRGEDERSERKRKRMGETNIKAPV